MAQKYLYIVEHFLPFPISECSGLWNVIAKDDNECFELIVKEDNEFNTGYYVKLRENIITSQKFALKDEYESSVIEAFLT
jgi:hypothetical protein